SHRRRIFLRRLVAAQRDHDRRRDILQAAPIRAPSRPFAQAKEVATRSLDTKGLLPLCAIGGNSQARDLSAWFDKLSGPQNRLSLPQGRAPSSLFPSPSRDPTFSPCHVGFAQRVSRSSFSQSASFLYLNCYGVPPGRGATLLMRVVL